MKNGEKKYQSLVLVKNILKNQNKKFLNGQKNKDTSYMNVSLTCPHCNKTGGFGMLRWHFDNCKMKRENE